MNSRMPTFEQILKRLNGQTFWALQSNMVSGQLLVSDPRFEAPRLFLTKRMVEMFLHDMQCSDPDWCQAWNYDCRAVEVVVGSLEVEGPLMTIELTNWLENEREQCQREIDASPKDDAYWQGYFKGLLSGLLKAGCINSDESSMWASLPWRSY